MDGRTGRGPHGFYVRIYDDRLVSRRKLVSVYDTADRCVMMYHVEGTNLKCLVRNNGDGFTFFSSQTSPARQYFDSDMSIEQVVCAGFNAEGRWLAPEDDEQLALF